MAVIKYVVQYRRQGCPSILYDVILASGLTFFYPQRACLPETVEAFLLSAKISYQYNRLYKRVEYVYH